jgi:hypothetical protein
MPKKLAQLTKDVDAIRNRYGKQVSELSRIKDDLPKHSGTVVQDQLSKLEIRIKELQKTGKKINVLGDASSDPVAKKLLDTLDTHKKELEKLYDDYWKAVNELDKIENTTGKSNDSVLKRIDAIIAEKQKQWFGSASLNAIKKIRTDLDTWYKDMHQTREDLGMTRKDKGIQTLPRPGSMGGFFLSESDIRRARVENLTWKWEPPAVNAFIKYFVTHHPSIYKKQVLQIRTTLDLLEEFIKSHPND